MMRAQIEKKLLPLAVHIAALIPAAWLVWDYFTGSLSFNPIQDMTLRTGKTALILLVLSLACTPINTVFKYRPVIRLRKWLGLYAFFYVLAHLLIFVWLDYGFAWKYIYEAIFEKPYALVGFSAFLILLPLAITSTQGWQKRLGKNWKKLHKAVYAANILAVVHFIWLVKSDIREPLIYGGIVALLLTLRTPVGKGFVRMMNKPRLA